MQFDIYSLLFLVLTFVLEYFVNVSEFTSSTMSNSVIAKIFCFLHYVQVTILQFRLKFCCPNLRNSLSESELPQ